VARADVSMGVEEIAAYLTAQRNATLASIGPTGFPHQVAMWFVPEPGRVVMWAYRRSQKAVNLRRNPRASLLVQDGETYDRLRGVVVQGEVDLIDDTPAVLEIGNTLHARYGGAYGDDPDAYRAVIAQQAPKRVGIALRMEHVFSWDFGKLPGSRTNRS
jgi:PPOX class probable F420-dependent enzyme